MGKSKFKTEIGNDFKVEIHEDYIVIGPMRFYADEEKEEEKKSDIVSDFVIPMLHGIFMLILIVLALTYVISFFIYLFT